MEFYGIMTTLQERPRLRLLAKRGFDLFFSLLLGLFLAPVLFSLAILIKLTSKGPVFYTDTRLGLNAIPFRMPKFRTMYQDADELKSVLMTHNEMRGPAFKIKNDPRVTPLGRFLRKHSLDELPQLWNILRGDMSLVGPRPPLPKEYEEYEPWHKKRLLVKPGATCLWQVKGRNQVSDFDDWVRLDLEYIQNWSLWLDFKIVFKTIWIVVKGTGC